MITELVRKPCAPCRGGIPPLTRAEAEALLVQTPDWALAEGPPPHLARTFAFPDFAAAQAFAVRVGDLAEAEGHHPELRYGWGYCSVLFWTHKIHGLHENDFIMAAKVNALAAELAMAQVGG